MLRQLHSEGKRFHTMKYWYGRENRGDNDPERLYILDTRSITGQYIYE